jgi:hypothetical protein
MATRAEAEIRQYLDAPLPPDAAEDLRDLGVIGYANSLPGVTPRLLRELIGTARHKGRSWDEIGRRLGMTAFEAEAAYKHLLEADLDDRGRTRVPAWRQRVAAAIRALQDALDSALGRLAAELERDRMGR